MTTAQQYRLRLIKTFALVAIGFTTLFGCGGSQIVLEVLLSVNQTSNPLLEVSQNKQNGTSRGVFFVLDELDDPPSSIDDVKTSGDTYSQPDVSGTAIGLDPLQDQFSISTTSLNPDTFYRVKMIAKDINGNITHTGTGDCPVKLSLSAQNLVKICFGRNDVSNPPLCAGLTTFSDCPGL